MSILELSSYLNFGLACFGTFVYVRNALRCNSPWKIWKFALGINLCIIAMVYGLFILDVFVDLISVRLNTTLLLVLIIVSGLLGRSKYGTRS